MGFNYADTNSVDPGTKSYLTGLKNSAEDLNALVRDLQNGATSDKETVVSSDSSSVSVKSSSATTEMDDVTINVEQAASGQINQGGQMTASRKIYSDQTYKFEIAANGKTHQISFSVEDGDTYEDMQRKMAKAINDKDIGIEASVDFDEKEGTSSLKIQSENTGDDVKSRFTIRDISGDAVRKTGTDQMTQDAQNAFYSVNGGEVIESKSNKVDLGDGVTATIKKATVGDVTIGMGKEKTVTYENVEELVKQFNTILGNVSDNSMDRGANRLMKQLSGLTGAYASSLEHIGIRVSGEGFMSINKDKLNESIADGSAENFFADSAGSNYGFTNRLEKITADVSKNTTSYVSKAALGSFGSPSDYFSQDNSALNYLQNYRYNQIANQGLLFDMFL
jgi:flagellar hook-associated protein 2